ANSSECGRGAAGIPADVSRQGPGKGPGPPNAAFTNPLRRNKSERAGDLEVVAFAQGDVEPSRSNVFCRQRILDNDRVDGCTSGSWICALFQIDQCSRQPCVRIGRNQFERPVQNCTEVSIAALRFVSEGQLLEEEEVA